MEDRLAVWDEITSAYERDEPIEGTITRRVNGGLLVWIKRAVKAFLPASQATLGPPQDLDGLVAQTLSFKVVKLDRNCENVILSRRAMLERERDERRKQALETLVEGAVVEGTVRKCTEFGAFIDVGGVNGLLHISEIGWSRVLSPLKLFQPGDRARVKVLKVDPATQRINLSMRQLVENPWPQALERYAPGTTVTGKVVHLSRGLIMVQLDEQIRGTSNVSRVLRDRGVKHASKIVTVGDMVEAVVLKVDAEKHYIALGFERVVGEFMQQDAGQALPEGMPAG